MDSSEVRAAIEGAIANCRISVDGEGCSFSAVVVSEAFRGLSPVKRQQLVLAAVKDWLATGALHAITVKTYTPEEWEKSSGVGEPVQIQ